MLEAIIRKQQAIKALTGRVSVASPTDRLVIQSTKLVGQDVSLARKAHSAHWAAYRDQALFITGILGLLVVIFLSMYALRSLKESFVRSSAADYEPVSHSYADRDGEAALEPTQLPANRINRLAILGIVVLGATISGWHIALATPYHLGSVAKFECWAGIAIWGAILLQCSALSISPSVTGCFAICWRAGLSAAVALFHLLIRAYTTILFHDSRKVLIALTAVEGLLAVTAVILCFLVPRRPDVFFQGSLVDRQYTASLLGWFSFSWIEIVLQTAEQKEHMSVDDLPEMDHRTRGETMYDTSETKRPARETASIGDLWWTIFRSHKCAILVQFFMTVSLSILSFVPQYALLRILILLEMRQVGSGMEPLWFPVIGLGLSVMVSASIETFKYWISYNVLAIRAQQQLSHALFDKTVRLRCISNPTKSQAVDSSDNNLSPVNLIAVDVKNVADFLCFSFLLYESPLKLGLALAFLVLLLGWPSVLSGVALLSLLTLVNTFAGRAYSQCQGALMQSRDRRLRLLSEMLQGIRQIKFSAQESRWESRINQLRDKEMHSQWTVCLWQILFVSISLMSPIILSATCLSIYVLLSGRLCASTAFTSVSVLASMEVAMTILPDIISYLLNAQVSMRRIQCFLAQPERRVRITPSNDITFSNATVAWPDCREGTGTLKQLDLQFPRHALSLVTGPTGSGKSLLLAAILGEADLLQGQLSAPVAAPFEEISHCPRPEDWLLESALAFVSQSPWLQNSTLRDNILLGLPMDEKRYAMVVFACALHKDFAELPHKDQTQISGKGANLSGGQRWRVSLARALYSRAMTLLLDDIFSALDVHTREHVYRHVLCGEFLNRRTCILVTHHLDLCQSRAQYLVHLENGTLKTANSHTKVSIDSWPGGGEYNLSIEEQLELFKCEQMVQNSSTKTLASGLKRSELKKEAEPGCTSSSRPHSVASVFLREGASPFQWLVLGMSFLAYGSVTIFRAWWMNIWTSNYTEVEPYVESDRVSTQSGHSVASYLAIYLALSALACLIGTARTYFSLAAALRASQRLFRKMLSAVLLAPLRWHDQVPLGDIFSRFSADVNVLDVRVGDDLRATLEFTMDVVMAIVASAIVNPLLLGISGLLLTVYLWCARRFITASRQLKALENAAKAPPLDHVDTVISGISTVRAFGQIDRVKKQFRHQVGRHTRAFWHLWLLNRWLGFRINVIGAAFSTISAVMVVYTPGISPSTAGFAIAFTIEVSLTMALSVRRYVNLEQGLNSMARIQSYSLVEKEHDPGCEELRDLPDSWPQQGRLEVSDLVVRHAPNLPPVLQSVSFKILPGARVGVVGRTGAGKSSLVLALFRFLDAAHGTILVDGVDISQVPLHQLRSRLAIIPQHPVLFRGTVRSNLDLFDEYDDAALLAALRAVGWHEINSNTPDEPTTEDNVSNDQLKEDLLLGETCGCGILAQKITDCGENLSHGQHQMLCLARAIIHRPKIMILDEATASVDMATDDLIQRSLRSALGQHQTTLLVVAHRLKTVADADTLLVMDNGRVVESGSPRELLSSDKRCFRSMVEQDPEREILERLIMGNPGEVSM